MTTVTAAVVEALLAGHPGVAEAVVAVLPAPGGAGHVVGFVRLSHRIDIAGLDRRCAEAGIGRDWRPAEYVIVDEMPRAGGGVDRRLLVERARRTDLAAL
ncbi:AMP-binding enzyme [Azospirillum sp. ST 5-10]|uniref:AMP-binding enzyme n=1 Tax=unclassified Azospirillum TaxID=2630922 RepID=UPI003F4A1AF0